MTIELPKINGRMKYVPGNVLNEINQIKQQDKINRDVEAFDRLVGYAQVGREIDVSSKKLFGFPVVRKKK